MSTVLWELVLILLATMVVTWIVLRAAPQLGLVHLPNERSSHSHVTPHGGGAGMVLVGSVAGVWLAWGDGLLIVVLCLAFFLALVGFTDDIQSVSARWRFSVQSVIVGILLWQIGKLPPLGPIQGWMLSGGLLFAGLWWINLFNFMDGIDGIAAVQVMSMLGTAAGLAAYLNPGILSAPIFTLLFIVMAATAGFLVLNWPPAKIFMGDVGSLWLGFILFALALRTIQAGWLNYQVWLILGAVFISDATVTLLTRLFRGEYWYEAHRNHAYQRLSRRLLDHFLAIQDESARRARSHRQVTLALLAINLLWLAPLAVVALSWLTWSWWAVLVAYLPIVVFVVRSGAGWSDYV